MGIGEFGSLLYDFGADCCAGLGWRRGRGTGVGKWQRRGMIECVYRVGKE